jgi:hypothetical protein
MDPLHAEALDRLNDAMTSLLPAAGDPALAPRLSILAQRVRPSGIGGLVGIQADPAGEILGRRVTATAEVEVRAASRDALPGVVASLVGSLASAGRAELFALGIQRLELLGLGPEPSSEEAVPVRRAVRFDVLFESLHRPAAAEGTIAGVPLEVATGLAGRAIYSRELGAGALADFEVFDDPLTTLGKPSDWRENAAERRIEQLSRIRNNSLVANPNNPGTYLVLRTTSARPEVADLRLAVSLRSDGPGALGVVFRFRDADNFYAFLMNRDEADPTRSFRMLFRKVGGLFQAFAEPAVVSGDAASGFEPGRPYSLVLTAVGDRFSVHLDGAEILTGRDGALTSPGRVGLASRNADHSLFHRLALDQLALR